MAIETKCQTPEAVFHTNITENNISCSVDLPMLLTLDEKQAELLEINLHNAMELVISRLFGEGY